MDRRAEPDEQAAWRSSESEAPNDHAQTDIEVGLETVLGQEVKVLRQADVGGDGFISFELPHVGCFLAGGKQVREMQIAHAVPFGYVGADVRSVRLGQVPRLFLCDRGGIFGRANLRGILMADAALHAQR